MQKKLIEIARMKVGYQAKRAIQEATDGTHYLIQSKNFNSFRSLNTDQLIKFFPERNPELYKVNVGDILFQAKGSEHFAYHISEPLENTLAGGNFYIIRPFVKIINPGYLAWWLNQAPSQIYLKSKAGFAVTSFIRKQTLTDLYVKIPPLDIQLKIQNTFELWQREQSLLLKIMAEKDKLIARLCLKSIGEGD